MSGFDITVVLFVPRTHWRQLTAFSERLLPRREHFPRFHVSLWLA